MPEPHLRQERAGEPAYYTDADGTVWRILDCTWRRGGWAWRNPIAHQATHRIFRAADGTRRVHAFTAGEPRDLELALLEAQLRAAGYLGDGAFDASRQQPR